MTDLNTAIFVGRLTSDMKISYIGQGLAKGEFTIAVNRSKQDGDKWIDEASFFNCVLWGKAAEGKKDKLLKGTQVGIQSHVHQERWEKDGQKQSKIVFVVDSVEILSKSSSGGSLNATGTPYNSEGNFKEDIPF